MQVPIATSAAAITLEHEGFVVEPAIDFNQRAGYLSVAKAYDRYAFKGSYAFKEVQAACCSPCSGYGWGCLSHANRPSGKGAGILTGGL